MSPLVLLAVGAAVGGAVYPAFEPPFIDSAVASVAVLALAALTARLGLSSSRLALLVAGLLIGHKARPSWS